MCAAILSLITYVKKFDNNIITMKYCESKEDKTTERLSLLL